MPFIFFDFSDIHRDGHTISQEADYSKICEILVDNLRLNETFSQCPRSVFFHDTYVFQESPPTQIE